MSACRHCRQEIRYSAVDPNHPDHKGYPEWPGINDFDDPEPTLADTQPPPGYHFTESSDRVAVKDEPTPDSGLDVERLNLAMYRTIEKRGESRKEWVVRITAEYARLSEEKS